jgi:hypothetical protein
MGEWRTFDGAREGHAGEIKVIGTGRGVFAAS